MRKRERYWINVPGRSSRSIGNISSGFSTAGVVSQFLLEIEICFMYNYISKGFMDFGGSLEISFLIGLEKSLPCVLKNITVTNSIVRQGFRNCGNLRYTHMKD